MRHDQPPPLQAEATLPKLPFAELHAFLDAAATRFELPLHSGHGRSSWIKVEGGEFGGRMGPEGSIVYARAHSRDRLFALQEAYSEQLSALVPDDVAGMRWSSQEKPGAFPPNFTLARVERVTRIGASFLRLRLCADNLARFAGQIIHFRLILQPAGTTRPEWPLIGENGQAVWPQGPATLHRPPYTVRAIDADAGWLETDIFVHPGGRACGFAATTTPGQPVGLTGPGGGGVPVADRILLAGDETAYPALARTIEAQGADCRGECILLGHGTDYPMPRHPGIRLTHAPQGEAELAARLSRDGCDADQIWIATEKSALAPLRRVIADQLAIPAARTHMAAYWTAKPAAGQAQAAVTE